MQHSYSKLFWPYKLDMLVDFDIFNRNPADGRLQKMVIRRRLLHIEIRENFVDLVSEILYCYYSPSADSRRVIINLCYNGVYSDLVNSHR